MSTIEAVAHEGNDEVLERITIGRRFKDDTERFEHLFDLYKQMTSKETKEPASGSASASRLSDVSGEDMR